MKHNCLVMRRYEHCVFPSRHDVKKAISYSAQYEQYKKVFDRLGRRLSHVTHCHRPSTTTRLQQSGASDVDIATFALWLSDDQHTCYQKLQSPDVLCKEAGFQDQRCYYLWRGQLDPGKFFPEMWRSVFPGVEDQLRQVQEVRTHLTRYSCLHCSFILQV